MVGGFAGMTVGWNAASVMLGLFIKPIQAEFGWSRTELSMGSFGALIVALLLPFAGALINRFGSRRISLFGLGALAAAWWMFAIVPAQHAAFIGAVIWLGIAGTFSSSVVFARGVAAWFSRNLGLSIGLMMTGASVATALGVPIIAAVIVAHGWRSGFQAMALATLLIGMPPILMWFREPPAHQIAHRQTGSGQSRWADILRSSTFWRVAAASGIAALPIGGFIGHLVPLLTDRGMSVATAASMVSIFALAVAIGRIANGLLLDRMHPPMVACTTMLCAAAGSLALATVNIANTGAFVVVSVGLIGLAQGAEGDYIKFFSMWLFGFDNFARVVAGLATTISLGMAAGGILFGRAFDLFGSYKVAVVSSAALYIVAGMIFLSIRQHPDTLPSAGLHAGSPG